MAELSDVTETVKQIIDNILGSQQAAVRYADDPNGVLAEQGITENDLGQVDIRQLVGECATGHNLPPNVQQSLQSYSAGGGAPSGYPVQPPAAGAAHQSAQEVVQHLNYVTYTTYEGDETITQQLINYENYDYSTNIDNSVDVEVDGDVHGDLDVETTNVNATGDGAVAAGDDIENAATGDGAQIIDGDNFGQANTGDGAVLAGDDINAPVNTGTFTGVQADGDVENTVVGDGNQTAQVSGDADNSVFNFGDGDVTNFGDADIDDAAVSVGGGDANNVSNNTVDDGSAVSAGGDATGSFEDTFVDADNSIVATEQGPGDLEQEENENEFEQEVAGA